MSESGPSFIKIWTCRSSRRSGSRNAWTRIKNFNVASRLSNFWKFFGSIQMISFLDWWPWTKPGYISMTRRQSNNQWSGGVAAHPAPKNSECKNSLVKFSPRFFGIKTAGILIIDYLPKGQTINAEYYSSLPVQTEGHFEGKTLREVHQGSLVLTRKCPGSPGTCNPEETGLPGLPLSWSPTLFSGSGPVGLPPLPWTEETIEKSPFFVRRGGHCWRGDLVGWTTFWISFEWLAKVRETG